MRTPFGAIETEGIPPTRRLAHHERGQLRRLGGILTGLAARLARAETVRDAIDIEAEIEAKLQGRSNEAPEQVTDREQTENDEQVDWSPEIQAAVTAAAEAGGGVVEMPNAAAEGGFEAVRHATLEGGPLDGQTVETTRLVPHGRTNRISEDNEIYLYDAAGDPNDEPRRFTFAGTVGDETTEGAEPG